jgi:L-alanine-DL-glutamate epimerase-like enolase superfamily enzyme
MLARVFKTGHTGATFGGIGTLDAALWDLKAKLAGEPLWRLNQVFINIR